MTDENPDLAAAIREIEELHAAFAAWMGPGAGPEIFARFEAAFAPEFSMVGPSGKRLDRAGVLAMLAANRAAFGAGFAIKIEAAVPLAHGPGFVCVGYDEIQTGRPGPLQRRASALFRADTAAANGLRWLAVHETWIASNV
ncbi:MAG: DUF4440 domain-containing protein [Telmatospirillum sp.]|nr:DUF4440 domain-containing protein [Telmatospirillum sp.]